MTPRENAVSPTAVESFISIDNAVTPTAVESYISIDITDNRDDSKNLSQSLALGKITIHFETHIVFLSASRFICCDEKENTSWEVLYDGNPALTNFIR